MVFEASGRSRLEFSGCCVKRGFTPQPGSPNMHISGPRPSKKTTKIQREDPQRGKKRTNFSAEEGKKERNFGRSRGRAVQGKGGRGKDGPGSPGGSPGV